VRRDVSFSPCKFTPRFRGFQCVFFLLIFLPSPFYTIKFDQPGGFLFTPQNLGRSPPPPFPGRPPCLQFYFFSLPLTYFSLALFIRGPPFFGISSWGFLTPPPRGFFFLLPPPSDSRGGDFCNAPFFPPPPACRID